MITDMSGEMSGKASQWVERFVPSIKAGGSVLDLACGQGRHSLLLAAHGYRVLALDRDAASLQRIRAAAPAIATRVADLERDPWPCAGQRFDGIVVTNYLFRPLLPVLVDSLAENGVLIYETFMVGNERFGKPSSAAFLLRPHELLDAVLPMLTVVAFEQGQVGAPRAAVVQRLCATRNLAPVLAA